MWNWFIHHVTWQVGLSGCVPSPHSLLFLLFFPWTCPQCFWRETRAGAQLLLLLNNGLLSKREICRTPLLINRNLTYESLILVFICGPICSLTTWPFEFCHSWVSFPPCMVTLSAKLSLTNRRNKDFTVPFIELCAQSEGHKSLRFKLHHQFEKII